MSELNEQQQAISAILDLKVRLQQLTEENANLKTDRAQVLDYLKALAACSKAHPDGYTIVDFQRVWLEQKDTRIAKLKRIVLRFHGLFAGADPNISTDTALYEQLTHMTGAFIKETMRLAEEELKY